MLKMYSTLLLMLSLSLQMTNAKSKVYMCYYGFYGPDQGREYYESLDYYMPLELCTHIIHDYGWFDYQAGSVFLRFSAVDSIIRSGDANTKVKAQKADVKFLVSANGYQQFIYDPGMRSKLVAAIQNFLTSSNMDGIDFKLQKISDSCNEEMLPANPQLFSQNFDIFIDELRSAVPDKIFMITIEADPSVTVLFNFKHLMSVLDYVNLKAYKSCLHLTGVTGFHAPIYASTGEFSVDSAVRQVLEAGVRRTKLVMSVRDGAQNFELTDPQNNGAEAPVEGAAPQTSLGSPLGIYRHCEVCGIYAVYRPLGLIGDYDFDNHTFHFYYNTIDTEPSKTIWISAGDLFYMGLYVPSMRLAGVSIYSFIHYNSANPDLCRDFNEFQNFRSSSLTCPWRAVDWLANRQ